MVSIIHTALWSLYHIPWWSQCPWHCCGSTACSTSARTSWSVHEGSRRPGCKIEQIRL